MVTLPAPKLSFNLSAVKDSIFKVPAPFSILTTSNFKFSGIYIVSSSNFPSNLICFFSLICNLFSSCLIFIYLLFDSAKNLSPFLIVKLENSTSTSRYDIFLSI